MPVRGDTHIENGESKHPTQVAEARFAPLFIRVDDRFGIGVGAKHVAAALELFPQRAEIVNFAIENDCDVARFIENRLVSAGKIDNTEPAHAHRCVRSGGGSDQLAMLVGSAMEHRAIHIAHHARGIRSVRYTDGSTNAAHGGLIMQDKDGGCGAQFCRSYGARPSEEITHPPGRSCESRCTDFPVCRAFRASSGGRRRSDSRP